MAENTASSPREEIAPLAAHEARLYINNLPWSVDNEQLTQWITQETQVKPLEVTVVQNKKYGRSRGYAFIKINKSDMAQALTLNGRHLQDRDIGVQEAAQRTQEERDARRAQQAAKREQQRQQRQAQQAVQQQSKPSKPAQSPSQSQAPAQPKKERAQRPKPVIKTYENATTIHFTNLSFKITADALRSFVEKAIGVSVVDVTIPVRTGKYRAGQSLGFGFVTVPNDKIDAALALNGQSLEDRVLKVSLAHVHQPEDSNSGAENTDAAPRQQRPKRRNAGRRPRGGKNAQNNGAADNNAAPTESAASPSAGQQAASGSQPKRNRNRNRRTPRAGAEEGEAQ